MLPKRWGRKDVSVKSVVRAREVGRVSLVFSTKRLLNDVEMARSARMSLGRRDLVPCRSGNQHLRGDDEAGNMVAETREG